MNIITFEKNLNNEKENNCCVYRQYEKIHYDKFINNNNTNIEYSKILRKYYVLKNFLYKFSTPEKFAFHSTKYHCAFIERRGKILASGENVVASPSNGGTCSGGKNYMHAEINAVKNLGNFYNLKGANMYIFRIGKMAKNSSNFVLKYSQPCPACTKFLNKCINKYGLQKIFFTCDYE